jgi:hypothetical protein
MMAHAFAALDALVHLDADDRVASAAFTPERRAPR